MRKSVTIAALLPAGTAVAHIPGTTAEVQLVHVLTSGHHVPVIIVGLVVLAGILAIARRGALLRRR